MGNYYTRTRKEFKESSLFGFPILLPKDSKESSIVKWIKEQGAIPLFFHGIEVLSDPFFLFIITDKLSLINTNSLHTIYYPTTRRINFKKFSHYSKFHALKECGDTLAFLSSQKLGIKLFLSSIFDHLDKLDHDVIPNKMIKHKYNPIITIGYDKDDKGISSFIKHFSTLQTKELDISYFKDNSNKFCLEILFQKGIKSIFEYCPFIKIFTRNKIEKIFTSIIPNLYWKWKYNLNFSTFYPKRVQCIYEYVGKKEFLKDDFADFWNENNLTILLRSEDPKSKRCLSKFDFFSILFDQPFLTTEFHGKRYILMFPPWADEYIFDYLKEIGFQL